MTINAEVRGLVTGPADATPASWERGAELGLRIVVGLCLLPVVAWVAVLCVACGLAVRCRHVLAAAGLYLAHRHWGTAAARCPGLGPGRSY